MHTVYFSGNTRGGRVERWKGRRSCPLSGWGGTDEVFCSVGPLPGKRAYSLDHARHQGWAGNRRLRRCGSEATVIPFNFHVSFLATFFAVLIVRSWSHELKINLIVAYSLITSECLFSLLWDCNRNIFAWKGDWLNPSFCADTFWWDKRNLDCNFDNNKMKGNVQKTEALLISWEKCIVVQPH